MKLQKKQCRQKLELAINMHTRIEVRKTRIVLIMKNHVDKADETVSLDMHGIECFSLKRNIILLNYGYFFEGFLVGGEFAVFCSRNLRHRFKIPVRFLFSITDLDAGKTLYAYTDLFSCF